MKNIIFVSLIMVFLLGCKKKNIESSEQIQNAQALEACFKGKEFPTIPKKDLYIEGEIDGKYFSFSRNENFGVRSTLKNFLALGYNPAYAKTTEWQGNGFAVYPIYPDTVKNKDQFYYYIEVGYQAFQGDSLAYLQFFNQFEKGKNFRYRNATGVEEATKPQIVDIRLALFGCSDPINGGNTLTSIDVEQTGSYFRVADVKNYQSASGEIYKRDVTIEFDVKLGGGEVTPKRIKNGRIFFSY
jgi:hypothetical protein